MLTPVNEKLPALQENLYERFLEYADIAPSSASTYRRSLRQLQKYLSERGISSPTRSDLLEWKRFLLETYKASTAQNYLSATKVFFGWLETEGIYPDVCRGIKAVRIKAGFKKDYLTPSMVRIVLSSVPDTTAGKRDKAIICLMVTCGLRTCEVVRARVGDLRPRGDKTVLYILGKGDTERTQYCIVPPETEKLIREYLAGRADISDDAPLFASVSNLNMGEAMTTRTVSGLVKHYLEKSGFSSERLSAHSLRHTAITLALMGGASLHEAQEYARHRSVQTTTHYAHELQVMENRASAAVAKAIF